MLFTGRGTARCALAKNDLTLPLLHKPLGGAQPATLPEREGLKPLTQPWWNGAFDTERIILFEQLQILRTFEIGTKTY
jgi:hypothetical protein